MFKKLFCASFFLSYFLSNAAITLPKNIREESHQETVIQNLSIRVGTDLSTQIFQGNKIYLVPIEQDSSDLRKNWISLLCNQTDDYWKYFRLGRKPSEKEAEEEYNKRSYNMWVNLNNPDSVAFFIAEKEQNNIAGMIYAYSFFDVHKDDKYLNFIPEKGVGAPTLGYLVSEVYSGRGFATEAVSILCDFLKILNNKGIYEFDHLFATCSSENAKSRSVLEKNKFKIYKENDWDEQFECYKDKLVMTFD